MPPQNTAMDIYTSPKEIYSDVINGPSFSPVREVSILKSITLVQHSLDINTTILLGPEDRNNHQDPYTYSLPCHASATGPYFIPGLKSTFQSAQNNKAILNKNIETVSNKPASKNPPHAASAPKAKSQARKKAVQHSRFKKPTTARIAALKRDAKKEKKWAARSAATSSPACSAAPANHIALSTNETPILDRGASQEVAAHLPPGRSHQAPDRVAQRTAHQARDQAHRAEGHNGYSGCLKQHRSRGQRRAEQSHRGWGQTSIQEHRGRK